MEATSTGVGMDLAAGCHGVPVSYRGAGSSAVILRVVPCRNFPSVRMVQSGSRVKDSLRMEVMFRQRGILFSLTGKMTEALIVTTIITAQKMAAIFYTYFISKFLLS